jgi:hypothetical protein
MFGNAHVYKSLTEGLGSIVAALSRVTEISISG